MFLTRFGIQRPVVVRMTFLLILVLGVYSYRDMPRYLDPDLTIGRGMVITVCPGFSPEEMEKLVTNRIEEELQGISEIRRFESNSFESTSSIDIFFQTDLSDREIQQGMQEVRNAVDRVDDLPEEAEPPRVLEIDTAVFPVCLVGLSGDLPMMQLQDVASDVGELLAEIEGVSEIGIYGEREPEIWVELDPVRMAGYGITVPQVARALAERSRNRPGGILEMGDHEATIRLKGEPDDPEALGRVALVGGDGATVFLEDIARVRPALERAVTRTFIDKKKALVLAVKRKKNTDMIAIVDEVKRLMAEMGDGLPGLAWTLYFDQARVSMKRIRELQSNAVLGVMAVFLVLWAALGLRNALYASVGIPVAFLITFTLMNAFGLSIDGVTLFGLILVLGILVDDAIVVLENIFRYMEFGLRPVEAALRGSREVFAPVLASVTTNMAAFFPLLFMVTGVIGRYLAILPQVVLFALAASLFEVFFMLPSHVVELTPERAAGGQAARKQRRDVFAPLRRLYTPYLRHLLRHRYVSVAVIVSSTVLAFLLYFQTDFEMFPKTDAFPRFNIHFDLPVGASLDRSEAVLMGLSDLVKREVGADLVAPIAIAGMKEVNYEPLFGPHLGMLNVVLTHKEERERSVKDILEDVRDEVEGYLREQGAVALALERLLEGPPVGADVDLKIQAPTWDQAAAISRHVQEALSRHPGIVDIRDNFSRDKPFMEVTVDEARARELGISQADLEMMVQAAFHGLPVGTYNRGDEEQEIKLKVLPEYRRDFEDLTRLRCILPGGRTVPLREVARVRMAPGFHDIYHYKGRQTVQLTANIRAGQAEADGFLANLRGERMTAVKANRIAREAFEEVRAAYPGARMTEGGLQEETDTSLLELRNAGVLALFLIFFILALQFNSFGQPFIIMITIPFVTLGVIVGLLVTQNPLTFVTLVGLLTLTGIVVNDSLVLIDFINRYRDESPDNLYTAILRACQVRMRPILLTSLTTIFGLAPMAFGLGGKSPFWAPLATAIMWGLAFATVLILSMVPAYYAILQDVSDLVHRRRRGRAEKLAQIDAAFGGAEE